MSAVTSTVRVWMIEEMKFGRQNTKRGKRLPLPPTRNTVRKWRTITRYCCLGQCHKRIHRVARCLLSVQFTSYQQTNNTNMVHVHHIQYILTSPISLTLQILYFVLNHCRQSRLYMQPPNNKFQVLLTFYRFYHTTTCYWVIVLINSIILQLKRLRLPEDDADASKHVGVLINPQNTYIQSWTVWEIMASEVWNFDSCYTLTDYQIRIETGRNMWFL